MDQSLRTRYYLNSSSVQLNVCFKAVRDARDSSNTAVNATWIQEREIQTIFPLCEGYIRTFASGESIAKCHVYRESTFKRFIS